MFRLRREKAKDLRHKLLLPVVVGILIALAAMDIAHATIVTGGVAVKVNGVAVNTVPAGTTVQVVCSYSDSQGLPGSGDLYVRYSSVSSSGPWTAYTFVQHVANINSGESITVNYQLNDAGYYYFRWQVENENEDFARVHAAVSVTLSEPATIAGLGVATLATCIALLLKKPKPSCSQ